MIVYHSGFQIMNSSKMLYCDAYFTEFKNAHVFYGKFDYNRFLMIIWLKNCLCDVRFIGEEFYIYNSDFETKGFFDQYEKCVNSLPQNLFAATIKKMFLDAKKFYEPFYDCFIRGFHIDKGL